MQKYIHIGYPKNFSTSLQRDYFSKHPEIYHLGIGINSNLGYKDSFIEKTFEVYLKTCKHYKYEEVEKGIIAYFNTIFSAVSNEYKAVGVSSEHLSFAFSFDSLSAVEKAKRLLKIFGEDTKIVMLVRNQFDLIKSLYRENVRVGFAGDFSSFLELVYKYQDRNFVYDFRYDLMFSTYADLFGKENVAVYFFEDYRSNEGDMLMDQGQLKIFQDLNSYLGLADVPMSLQHHNETIPKNKILLKAELNRSAPHDLGNHLLESAEKHRIKSYLEEDLLFFEAEEKTYSDVLTKRRLKKEAVASSSTVPLTYMVDKKISSWMKNFYEDGNLKLQENIKKNIPTSYQNLEF